MYDSREELCASKGLDPARPFVLYAACTPFLAPNEHLVVERLADDLAKGAVPGRPQLLVRLHPADPGTRFADLEERPNIALDMPGAARDGRPAGIYAFCPDAAENRRAIAMIAHADVVVNIASTISLEAAIADRPTINVAYDLAPGSTQTGGPDRARIAGYYRYDHYQTVTDSGAVRIVHDPASLTEAIRDYLAAPSLHHTERAELARLWCSAPDQPPADGLAGARLGAALAARLAEGFAGHRGDTA
jgi:CDP-glycerol glycerophosphotransferase (TagB/SpsB family)